MPGTLSRRAFLSGFRNHRSPLPQAQAAALVASVGGACLSAGGVACGTCADPCEPRALRMRPLPGGRALPVIDASACTGCGDCLSVCPVGALSLVPAASPSEEQACA
ncbi:MAG TPA: 4Fe-4S dicluster domain-containing protein [Magnetospirillum sp.]|nr:4Fe-4S dicluster domain-containing protein [Magnetospirillum sp.]